MKLMAFIDCDDLEDGDDASFILEVVADRIRGAVTDVLLVRAVRVGRMFENVDDLVQEIKKELEDDETPS